MTTLKKEIRIQLYCNPDEFYVERTLIQNVVLPRLRHFCLTEFNTEFVIIDPFQLPSGLEPPEYDVNFYVDKLEECNKISEGPCALVLLGDKYGGPELPRRIPKTHYEEIFEVVKGKNDASWLLLENKYTYQADKYEDNTGAYVLTEEEVSRSDVDTILRGLDIAARESGTLSSAEKSRYCDSDIHQFTNKAIRLKTSGLAIYAIRQVRDIEQYITTNCSDASTFLDIDADGRIVKQKHEKVRALQETVSPRNIRENVLKFSLGYKTLLEFSASTSSKGHNAIAEELERLSSLKFDVDFEHPETYLSAFAKQVLQRLKTHISSSCKKIDFTTDRLKREIQIHSAILGPPIELGSFHSREREISILEKYIDSGVRVPGLLNGESGCGKSTLIKNLMSRLSSLMPTSTPIIIFRSAGKTSSSSTLQQILSSITEELARTFKRTVSRPCEYAACVYDFWSILSAATGKQPVLIVIDDIEFLHPLSHIELFRFLPSQLPPCVKILLTTSHEAVFAGFKRRYGDTSVVSIPGLPSQMMISNFPEHMKRRGKCVNDKSNELANHLLQQNNTPLFAEILEDVLPIDDSEKLQDRTKLLFGRRITSLEETYQPSVVKYILSYLACSKFGLSLSEIWDILSLDNVLVQECRLDIKAIKRFRMPLSYILPILSELRQYLQIVQTEERYLYTFKHDIIRQAVNDHFSITKEYGNHLHSALAEYWTGRWSGNKAKYLFEKMTDTEETKSVSIDRQIPLQPFYWTGADHIGITYCNERKISELPTHLLLSDKINDLYKNVIFNFEFLYTKLTASTVNDLVSEMYYLRKHFDVKNNKELEVLISLMRLLAPVLENDPDYLSSELAGRLSHLVGPQLPNLTLLVQQVDSKGPQVNVLLPTHPCFPTIAVDETRIDLPVTRSDVICAMSGDNRFLATLLTTEPEVLLIIWDSKTATKSQIIGLGVHKGVHFQNLSYIPQTDELLIITYTTNLEEGYFFVNLNTSMITNKLSFAPSAKVEILYLSKSYLVIKANGTPRIYSYGTAEPLAEIENILWPFYITPSDKYLIASRQLNRTSKKHDTTLCLVNVTTMENICIIEHTQPITYMLANSRSEVLYIGCKQFGTLYKYDIGQVAKRDIRRMKQSADYSIENNTLPDEINVLFQKYKTMTSVFAMATGADERYLLVGYNISDIKKFYAVWQLQTKTVCCTLIRSTQEDIIRFSSDGGSVYQFVPHSDIRTTINMVNISNEETSKIELSKSIHDAYVMKGGVILVVYKEEVVLSTVKQINEQYGNSQDIIEGFSTALSFPTYNEQLNIIYNNDTQTSDFSYFNLDSNHLFTVDMSHNYGAITKHPVNRYISPDGTKIILEYGSQLYENICDRSRQNVSNYLLPRDNKGHMIKTQTDFRKPQLPGVNYFTGLTDAQLEEQKRTRLNNKAELRRDSVYEQRILRVFSTSNTNLLCQVSLTGERVQQVSNECLVTFRPDYASMTRDPKIASDILSAYNLATGEYMSATYLDNAVISTGLVENYTKLYVCCGFQGQQLIRVVGKFFNQIIDKINVGLIMKTADEYQRSVNIKSMRIFKENPTCVLFGYCWRDQDKEIYYAKIDLQRKDVIAHFQAVSHIQDVSKDGRLGVDQGLRLYDLNRGEIIKQLNPGISKDFDNLAYVPRFMDDAEFIIVLDNQSNTLQVIRTNGKTQIIGKSMLHRMKKHMANNSPLQISLGYQGRVFVLHNTAEFKVFVVRENIKSRPHEPQYKSINDRAKNLMPRKKFNQIDAILGKRLVASREDESTKSSSQIEKLATRKNRGKKSPSQDGKTSTSPVSKRAEKVSSYVKSPQPRAVDAT